MKRVFLALLLLSWSSSAVALDGSVGEGSGHSIPDGYHLGIAPSLNCVLNDRGGRYVHEDNVQLFCIAWEYDKGVYYDAAYYFRGEKHYSVIYYEDPDCQRTDVYLSYPLDAKIYIGGVKLNWR